MLPLKLGSCFVLLLSVAMSCISATRLSDFMWKRRLLVIAGTSDDANNNALRQITDSFQYKCDMSVRNMNVILVGDKTSSVTAFNYDKTLGPQVKTSTINQFDTDKIVDGLSKNGHGKPWAVLVGYDGGKKRQYSTNDVQAYIQEMFDTIDRMPMRRREMEEQRRDGISCGLSTNSGANRL